MGVLVTAHIPSSRVPRDSSRQKIVDLGRSATTETSRGNLIANALLALAASHSPGVEMATLTIRDFDDDLKAALRVRAAEHGRSMEAEVREILRAALTRPTSQMGMATRIRRRFAGSDDLSIELPARAELPRAAEIGE